MNIPEIKNSIRTTMKSIISPGSVSKEEREKNKAESIQAHAAYAYADEAATLAAHDADVAYDAAHAAYAADDDADNDAYDAYVAARAALDAAAAASDYAYSYLYAAYAADRAAEAACRGEYKEAQGFVNKYFKITGENKQDYIDAIKKESA